MANDKHVRAPRLRRFAGAVGSVAATALCFSFAWSVVGGALSPTVPAPVAPIAISAATRPTPDAVNRTKPSAAVLRPVR